MTDQELQTLRNLGHDDAADEIAPLRAERDALEQSSRTYFAERNSARDAWRERVKRCEALEAERDALRGALALAKTELQNVLASINADMVHFDGDEFHETLNAVTAALAHKGE